MPLIRSISGLRGTLDSSLTPEVIVAYASAFAEYCGVGSIVVGRDGRPSGVWIEEVVSGTLMASGRDVRLIGMAPTPTVQLATEHSTAAGGISITASHNPSEWNGLKFLDRNGIFLGPAECAELFAIVDRSGREYAAWSATGRLIREESALARHVEATLALPFVDTKRLRERRFKVVVDAVNASGSTIVPDLLERCGAQVIRLHCDGTGIFPHTPEPIAENLQGLSDAVTAHGADLGIAVDPDADRLVLIDERGEPIGEEYTITIAADYILGWERRRGSTKDLIAVVNLSTTRAVDDVAERYGATTQRTPVGEINVALKMKETGAVIGGEGSGGVILPALHYGRDSLAGIVITLHSLLEYGLTLSALRASLPCYEIVKKKASLAPGDSATERLARIATEAEGSGRITTGDGVKIDFERSWVHLRASNTEPIIRVIAEAPTELEAEEVATGFMERVKG
jgi:phosphomannomutase